MNLRLPATTGMVMAATALTQTADYATTMFLYKKKSEGRMKGIKEANPLVEAVMRDSEGDIQLKKGGAKFGAAKAGSLGVLLLLPYVERWAEEKGGVVDRFVNAGYGSVSTLLAVQSALLGFAAANNYKHIRKYG